MEVKCPKCRRRVTVTLKEAEEQGKVRCPCGEEIALVKMI